MIIRAAYVGVILIWTTTPLAIQWSSQGGGYLFGITTRMLIGLCVLHALFRLAKWPHNRTPKAMLVYA
ncbi:MAG: EamA family transporter, partial [Gammaproteobacteria bacterium]|nr:EamA family transporter [Gammaproteobacteria bacterium]